MKAFLIVGVGFYHQKEKSWDGVGLSIAHEIDVPAHIQIPKLPKELNSDEVDVTIVGMEAIENPNDGMNAIKGFLVCSSREKATTVVRDIRDKIESGDLDPLRGGKGCESNPIDDFIFKHGSKDFFAKN